VLVAAALAAATLSACNNSTSSVKVLTGQPAAAIFPYYANGVRYVTAAAAAKDFAVQMLAMSNPTVGAYQRESSRAGLVDVSPPGGATPTVVRVSRLLGDQTWWVTGATCAEVVIDTPTTLQEVSSPISLTGSSTAFEAVVNVSLYADGTTAPIATTTVMGGSNGTMGPYQGSLSFPATNASHGSLVVYTRDAKTGATATASAVRVKF
jgi:hypothetical protein